MERGSRAELHNVDFGSIGNRKPMGVAAPSTGRFSQCYRRGTALQDRTDMP
jgi:hypothetical protein